MDTEIEEVTNLSQIDFVPFVSSVMPTQGSILPDRFTSTSGPVDTSLVTSGLNSDSGPREPVRRVGRSK